MDLSITEIQVSRNTKIKAGDRAVVHRVNFIDSPYILTYIISVSEKVIHTSSFLRFSRDGWQYEEEEKYSQRLLLATPELVEYVHRKTMLERLRGVLWEAEATTTLEYVLAVYDANKGIVDPKK